MPVLDITTDEEVGDAAVVLIQKALDMEVKDNLTVVIGVNMTDGSTEMWKIIIKRDTGSTNPH